MVKNMGMLDRIVRLIIAVMIAVILYYKQLSGLTANILGLIAVIFIVTGISGHCHIYHLFRAWTKKKK